MANTSHPIPVSVSYTDAEAQDAVGGILSASFAYVDGVSVSLSSAVLASLSKADTAIQSADLATVATTGDYDDLSNLPTLGTAAATNATAYATAAQGATADTAVQPADLATVATSGAYSDLTGSPTIPTVSDTAYNSTSWNANTDAPTKNAVRDQLEIIMTAVGTKLISSDIGVLIQAYSANLDSWSVLNPVSYPTFGDVSANYQDKLAEGLFVDGDKTKLNGIEEDADVTDAANVGSTIHGATAKTTPVDADTVGLIDSAASNVLKKLSWASIKATLKTYFDGLYSSKTAPYHIEVALSTNGENIAAGAKKGVARVHTAGTITGIVIDCDPANEPSATSVEVDLNTLDRSTGTATSVLSAVATIATSGNTGTGTVSGTPSVSAGDLLSMDVDQGSDGKELLATIQITPT